MSYRYYRVGILEGRVCVRECVWNEDRRGRDGS